MRANILKRSFYEKNTLKAARDLLGCFLVRKIGKKIIRGIITETEAYIGEDDLACHASRGRTPRTQIMYGEAGHAYVYLIYGMHYCLNVVTERKNFPAAVLIRSVDVCSTIRTNGTMLKNELKIERGNDRIILSGPGKVCRFFRIDKKLNSWDLARGEKLWMEKGLKIQNSKIKSSKRIGIDYAGHCRHYLWRFNVTHELARR